MKGTGIDLIAFEPNKAELLILELKGVTKEKSDMHEAIVQMFERFTAFKKEASQEKFERIRFGSVFPYFASNVSKSHYENKFDILRQMYNEEKVELLYRFQASPKYLASKGREILRPFVEETPSVIELIRKGKVMLLLVEGINSILDLTSGSQLLLH